MHLPIPNVYLIGVLMSAGTAIFMNLRQIPAAGFKHAKGWLRRKLVYSVRIYQYDELFYILEQYLFDNYHQQYKDVEASTELVPGRYSGPPDEESEATKRIYYKQEDNTFIIRYKGKKFMVQKESEKMDKMDSPKDRFFRKYWLTGWKCQKEITDFLDEVFQQHERNKPKGTIKIKVSSSYGEWSTFDNLKVKPLSNVLLHEDVRSVLENDILQFCRAEEWYDKVGIPYKRGYCFYGDPGNGKTTLSLALAAHLKRDIHMLNLGAMDDDTALQRAFSSLRRNSILLIEDIDKAFIKREAKQEKVSFSALLNLLDGALSKHGLIVIITTNHIDHLDPALLRDGRIDVKVAIFNPDNRMISDYLSLFYDSPLSIYGRPEVGTLCMASVQEICVRHKNNCTAAVNEITSKIISRNIDNKFVMSHKISIFDQIQE